jgi:hypothetical protein
LSPVFPASPVSSSGTGRRRVVVWWRGGVHSDLPK